MTMTRDETVRDRLETLLKEHTSKMAEFARQPSGLPTEASRLALAYQTERARGKNLFAMLRAVNERIVATRRHSARP